MRLTGLLLLLLLDLLAMAGSPTSTSSRGHYPVECEWKFTSADSGTWRNAIVPGCVFTDLHREGVIPDPFAGTNEAGLQWIGQMDWIYQSEPFEVDPAVLNEQIVRMRFNGLDTYADVFLNDEIILRADNAFRSWEIDVKGILKKKSNVLRIVFHSPLTIGESRLKELPYPLPGDGIRAVTRKPQFHFGWDWGPKLLSCGISKPIELIAFSTARIQDMYIRQDKVTEESARITAMFEIEATKTDVCSLFFEVAPGLDSWKTHVEVKKGINLVELPVTIPWPLRWWCNDQGAQHRYTFTAKLSHRDTQLDERSVKTGLRSIEFINRTDSIGETFYFSVNGTPVFAKGANYIPITYFPAEATPEDYRELLTKCKDAHFNMLRVWGGGVYEEDVFYDLCDELGILVWQDFMFACSMYPADSLFVTNVIAEAEEQTRRLRNYACISLWCGNNENAEGWERWGWQSGLEQREKDRIWRAYLDVFDLTLKPIVKRNTGTAYWESSPRYGRADQRSFREGDSHYWGLWHDAEPFEKLKQRIPRFMSEFGMQSFPSASVLKEMTGGDKPTFDHAGFAQHQKHPRGFQLMDDYIQNWYGKQDKRDVERYRRLSQAMQAEGMCMGIEAQRRSAPRCMGTLYWQLNDVWPSFSWSSIDYTGQEKLFFQMLRDSYAPQLISIDVQDGQLYVYWINDNNKPEETLDLFIAIRSFDGTERGTVQAREIIIKPGVQLLYTAPLSSFGGLKDPADHVIVVELNDKEGITRYRRYMKLVPDSREGLIPVNHDGYIIPELLPR